MHVAVSILTLTPGAVGGSETYVRGLLGAFSRGAGPERVTVLATAATAAGFSYPAGPVEVEAVAVPQLPAARLGRAAGLLRGLVFPPGEARRLADAADVLHLPLTVPVPRGSRPVVVSLYDVLHHDLPAMFSRPERAFRRLAYDRTARRANRVVTTSEHARGRIAAHLGIDGARIVAIPPGLDHERFRPGPVGGDEEALSGLELPPAPWLLYPANLWPHKNHERLLAALGRCPAELSLVLTGATYGRLPSLMRSASRLGVAERVRHLGFLRARTLPALYRSATGVVFPSLAEGFGAPVIEAMACGAPVAASSTGAVAEASAGAALPFDPADVAALGEAMTRLVRDDALRDELSAAGLVRAREVTWERCAARHHEVYASVSLRSTASRP